MRSGGGHAAEGRARWVGQAEGLKAEGAQLPTAVGQEKGSREGRAAVPPSAAIAALRSCQLLHRYLGPVCSFRRLRSPTVVVLVQKLQQRSAPALLLLSPAG